MSALVRLRDGRDFSADDVAFDDHGWLHATARRRTRHGDTVRLAEPLRYSWPREQVREVRREAKQAT